MIHAWLRLQLFLAERAIEKPYTRRVSLAIDRARELIEATA